MVLLLDPTAQKILNVNLKSVRKKQVSLGSVVSGSNAIPTMIAILNVAILVCAPLNWYPARFVTKTRIVKAAFAVGVFDVPKRKRA